MLEVLLARLLGAQHQQSQLIQCGCQFIPVEAAGDTLAQLLGLLPLGVEHLQFRQQVDQYRLDMRGSLGIVLLFAGQIAAGRSAALLHLLGFRLRCWCRRLAGGVDFREIGYQVRYQVW